MSKRQPIFLLPAQVHLEPEWPARRCCIGGAGRLGEIGFVGLGSMGTAMAANSQPVDDGNAYVRCPTRSARGTDLRPTTDLGDLLDCKIVIACCRTMMPCAKSCSVAKTSIWKV